MAQGQQGLALATEPDPEPRVGPHVAVHDLERRGPSPGGVARAVDGRLAAPSDALLELPGADRPLVGERHRRAGSRARAVDCAQARAAT